MHTNANIHACATLSIIYYYKMYNYNNIGEHLHSDLAVVNLPDFSGFKYVLTVVDEISVEVVVTLLKTKGA